MDETFPICHWIEATGTWVLRDLTSNQISDHAFDTSDIWAPHVTSQGDLAPGMNWPEGQATLENGCVTPVVVPPEPPVVEPPPVVVAPPVEAAVPVPAPAHTSSSTAPAPAPEHLLPKTGAEAGTGITAVLLIIVGGMMLRRSARARRR